MIFAKYHYFPIFQTCILSFKCLVSEFLNNLVKESKHSLPFSKSKFSPVSQPKTIAFPNWVSIASFLRNRPIHR
jgi:hypothetical protein